LLQGNLEGHAPNLEGHAPSWPQ